MRTTTRTSGLGAFVLAATLVLGGCSEDQSPSDDTTATTAPADADSGNGTDDTNATQAPAGDDAGATATVPAPDASASTLDPESIPDPVAEVDGESIDRESFLTAYAEQQAVAEQQAQMGGAAVDEEELKQAVLDLLIDGELLQQEGERLGLEATDEEIDAELTSIAEENGISSTEELLALLEEQGIDEEQAREEIARIVLVDKVLEERGGVESPSEQELRDYYEEMTGQSADDAAATSEAGEGGEAAMPSFEELREPLEDQLVQEKQTAALDELLTELREQAEVTSHL
ncbi:SurA N-terminal domain-containing protein [Ornithinimicrobium sp. Y1847]|uniref:SurA N-terminal domain-containing protein n=1 Tax=unclassified Ornithinimicrobium TaxID=2615080 RepID=UPI003B674263